MLLERAAYRLISTDRRILDVAIDIRDGAGLVKGLLTRGAALLRAASIGWVG